MFSKNLHKLYSFRGLYVCILPLLECIIGRQLRIKFVGDFVTLPDHINKG